MTLTAERPHRQYGSAIFVKSDTKILSTSISEINDVEILTIELTNCTVTSVYKPPMAEFIKENICLPKTNKVNFIVGDFNSRSELWGYPNEDKNGETLIQWADANDLALLHDSKLPASFNSARWKRGSNPDLIFLSERITHQCLKSVCSPIPNTQHRPIMCQVTAIGRPQVTPFRRRYNFKKANWSLFTKLLDAELARLPPFPHAYEDFAKAVQKCSRQTTPRGCRSNYVQGLSRESKAQLQEYHALFESNPLGERTIEAGKQLLNSLAIAKREKWIKLMEELDMSKSSHKAWRLLRRLNSDQTQNRAHVNVTANEIATHLMKNGKPSTTPPKHQTTKREAVFKDAKPTELCKSFTMEELNTVLKKCKLRKAAGLDDILTEQIKHFGPTAKKWLLNMFNSCMQQCKIPKIWRKAKVIAVPKPGKDLQDPKNYRPISLLCHTYKMFERLIQNRVTPRIEPKIIQQQVGFRPKRNCTAQVLNLTQHIENGFQEGLITGAVFIDLTAAYDTINVRLLVGKLYDVIEDAQMTNMIANLLRNRRFQVEFQGKRSRWRNQNNGLPQGSVLAPLLFNIYTNDQPLPLGTNSYIYADDRAVTSQGKTFEEVEKKLNGALKELTPYYKKNQLRPNPMKTQVCVFHLRNKQANRKLQIQWENTALEHCPNPKYLGVTLDRSLTYKKHCMDTKLKVSGRNNIIRKLTNSNWGAQPRVLRTSALALCHSAGEYACPVWYKSTHAKQVDVALNETSRIITGCMKPTCLDKIHHLAGIAPADVRREAAAFKERLKAEELEEHTLYGKHPARQRLKSRKSFLKSTENFSAPNSRIDLWRKVRAEPWMEPLEDLAPGWNEDWTTWKSLNRLRCGTARSRVTLSKWGYSVESTLCDCGAQQTTTHMYDCPLCPARCTLDDLMKAKPCAIEVARYWAKNI